MGVLPVTGASAADASSGDKLWNILWLGSSSTPPHLVRFVNTMLEASGRKVGWSAKVRGYFNVAYWVRDAEGLDVKTGAGKPYEKWVRILEEEAAAHPPDFVVIQIRKHSVMFPEVEEKLPEYVRRFCKVIRTVGAEPVFFVAPGYNKDEDQARLTQLVQQMAEENRARVAWGAETVLAVAGEMGWEQLTNIKAGDAGHMGPYGNYAYAAALFPALTGESPVGNPAREIITTGWSVRFGDDIPDDDNVYATVIPEAEARAIRETAWQIYKELSPPEVPAAREGG